MRCTVRRDVGWVVALAAVGLVAGCGGRSRELVAVSGRVTLDGKPLAGATVTFAPQAKPSGDGTPGPSSAGQTDADGRFALRTIDASPRDGAVVGPHRVTISTVKNSDASLTDDSQHVYERVIPAKYLDGRNPLTFEVPAGGTTEANFNLDSRGR